ncbi:MAG: hypothetical protein QOJ73_1469 [Streptosporangiaceae bacterium]|jgi:hypothetical protein|nr:hypothetical protein [Streptosporangiaceae bacterium]
MPECGRFLKDCAERPSACVYFRPEARKQRSFWRSVGSLAVAPSGSRNSGTVQLMTAPIRVKVRADRDAAVLVDGVGDPVVGLGGVLPGWQHADVVDHYEIAAAGPGHGPAGLGPGDRGGGGLEGEPGDAQALSIAAWARASTRCDLPVPEGRAS